jgi:hypothetical protein
LSLAGNKLPEEAGAAVKEALTRLAKAGRPLKVDTPRAV